MDYPEFTGGGLIPEIDSTWNMNGLKTGTTSLDSTCFFPIYLVGGYGLMDSTSGLTKTVSLIPHFKLSVSVFVYEIGNIDATARLYIDGTSYASYSVSYSNPTPYLDGKTCKSNPLFHQQLYYSMNHQSTSLTISISVIGSGTFYWGINNFVISVQGCHPTCKTCTGPLKTQCTACDLLMTLSASGECACNYGYILSIVTQCTASPCSSCMTPILNCIVYDGSLCAQCDNGYILSTYKTTCYSCSSSCKTCSLSTSNCTSCYTNSYLENNLCKTQCNTGHYGSNIDNTCQPCDSSCFACSVSSTNCTSCNDSTVLEGNICKSQCSLGFYAYYGYCLSCLSPCLSCSGTYSNCSQCINGTYLDLNTCHSQCSSGKYGDNTDLTCKSCDTSCLTCNTTATKCTSCKIGTYLDGNACKSNCSNGYYGSNIDNVCHICDSSCLTCSTSSTQCTSCISGTYLQGSLCKSTCSNGYYIVNSDNICHLCDSSCSTCISTATQCTACKTNTYLDGNVCKSTCSNGYYGSNTDNTCHICDNLCLNCVTSATQCTSCKASTYLENNLCKSKCSNGYYGSDTDNICHICDTNCLTCVSSATQCSSCKNSTYLEGNLCKNTCSSGSYASTIDNICYLCDNSCLTCVKTPTQCTSCKTNTYLEGNLCTSTCSNGYYASNTDSACHLCDSSCLTCISIANTCTSCRVNTYLDGNTCKSTCTSGYYGSAADNTCQICDISCLSCVNSPTQCTSCKIGAYLESNMCKSSCSNGYFASNIDNVCHLCDINCLTCAVSATQCTSCKTNSFLEGNLCKTTCSNGYYSSNTDKICYICDINCLTCVSTAIQCTSCKSNTYLEGSICISTCLNGYYGSNIDNTCHLCDNSCLTCSTSATQCSACKNNTYLEGSSCKSTCSNGYYSSDSDNKCHICDASCLTCVRSANTCTSCKTNTYLEGNICKSTCSNGYYSSNSDNMCHICDNSCLSCTTSASQCTSCKSNTYLDGNSCASSCSQGYYPSNGDNTCKKCDSSCQTCENSATFCISCPNHSILSSNACVSICSIGTFYIGSSCVSCDTSCLSCDKISTNCTSCKQNTYLLQNSCVVKCPSGFYQSITDFTCKTCDLSICLKCEYNPTNCTECKNGKFLDGNLCKNCEGNCTSCIRSADNCDSCSGDFFLYDNKCVMSCPEGEYRNSLGGCEKCDLTCKTCVNQANECLTCNKGYNLVSKNCEKVCDKNQFFDKDSKNCLDVLKSTANLYKNYTNSNSFSLIFSNFTTALLTKIENNQNNSFNLSISSMLISEYSYKITRSTTNGVFIILFDFKTTIKNSNLLTISFNTEFLSDLFTIFITNKLSCSIDSNLIYITPTLETTSDPKILTLSFSGNFLFLFNKLSAVSSIIISDFDSNNYNYSFQNTSNPCVFTLHLNYKISLVGIHYIEMLFTLPSAEFDIQQQKLTITKLKVQLLNFYFLSEDEKKAVEDTKKSSEISSSTASSATSVASVANSGSSLAYSALLLMKFIKFLKFLNINYPPNALAVFEAEMNFFDVLPSFKINHDDNPVDMKFDYYGVDNYILNNRGMLLCQNLIVIAVALLVNFMFTKGFLQFSCSFLNSIFLKFYDILCWNFLMTFLIGCINDFFFYSVINLAFATTSDFLGVFNIFISVFLIISNLVFLYIMYIKITQINFLLLGSKVDSSGLGKRHLDKSEVDIDSAPLSPFAIKGFSTSMATTRIVSLNKVYPSSPPSGSGHKESNDSNCDCLNDTSKVIKLKPITIKKNQVSFVDDKSDKFNSQSDIILNEPISSSRKTKRNKNVNFLNDTTDLQAPPSLSAAGYQEKESTFSNKCISISSFRKKVNSTKLTKTQIAALKEDIPSKDYDAFFQKYKILYQDFKQESRLTSVYFVLDLVKFPVISLIIVLDRYHPLRQSCFISGVTLGMLLFLILLRPLKSKYMFVQFILNQTCVLFCTISALALAYYDEQQDYDQEKRLMVGWVIVYGNLGLIYFMTAIMMSYFLLILYSTIKMAYQYIKKKYNSSKDVLPFEETDK